jgi:hypothetical protein
VRLPELKKLKHERRALVLKVEVAQGSIRIEKEGAKGGELDVHQRHRIAVWQNVIINAQKKLAVIDKQINALAADDAANVVRETVEQINASGATPDKAARLQHSLFVLVSARRVGQSSEMIRRKIERLMNPTQTLGVRVNDQWSDFCLMIKERAVA